MPLNVLLLIDQMGNRWSSQEDFCLAMAEEVRRRGGQCVVAYSSHAAPHVQARLLAGGAILEIVNTAKQSLIPVCFGVRRLCAKYRIGVIHLFHYPPSTPLTACLPMVVPAAVVMTDFTSGIAKGRTGVERLAFHAYNRTMTAGIARFVAPSEYVRTRLIESRGIAPRIIECVLNGVDLERFHPADPAVARSALGIPLDVPVILTASNLLPPKAVDVLIRAFGRVAATHPEAVLVIAGDGPERTTLERLAAEANVATRTRFLGQRDDVHALLPAATVFCCPSIWGESFGWVNAEAMACGVPVISTRSGAIPEVVAHGECGLLVPPRDSEAMADALLAVLGSREQRAAMATAGRARAETRFALGRTIAEHLSLYERAAG